MHLLLVHNEIQYFAGAQRVMGYYLDGLSETPLKVTVARTQGGRIDTVLPSGVNLLSLPNNQRFRFGGLLEQVNFLADAHRRQPFDIVHGWTARDWELCGFFGRRLGVPAVGTLHDHPGADFISSKRRWLMRMAARLGLARVVCVSEAVRRAAESSGYPKNKLEVVHNGLPWIRPPAVRTAGGALRLGFLGAFSARKGLEGVFEIMDHLVEARSGSWVLKVAGQAQDEAGQRIVDGITAKYSNRDWWSRVDWVGWMNDTRAYLESIDVLLFTSTAFDPFPTVLLEAGFAGVPAIAADVGGVTEIIEDGRTGFVFRKEDWLAASKIVERLLANPVQGIEVGEAAYQVVRAKYSVEQMVRGYMATYAGLG